MEAILNEVDWALVVIGFVLVFPWGWVWYSPYMFVKGWLAGIGEPVWRAPMWMPMLTQAVTTLFYAMYANLALTDGQVTQYVLVTLILAGFIKANGLFAGKSKYAISVEVGFILAMAVVLYVVNVWL